MSELLADMLLAVFLVFCRIGGCLMIMPGIASMRVPVRVRLYVVIAVTLALSPLLFQNLQGKADVNQPSTLFMLIMSETIKGFLIGFIGRLFLAAVEFAGNAISSFAGFSALPGAPIEGTEPVPAMASFIMLSATLFIFIFDLHWMVLYTLVDSYQVLPAGDFFEAQASLITVTDKLFETTMLAGRLAAPFLIFSILINLAMGLTNKLTPQIPVFFVSLPFILAGGLFVLWFSIGDLMRLFSATMAHWLGG